MIQASYPPTHGYPPCLLIPSQPLREFRTLGFLLTMGSLPFSGSYCEFLSPEFIYANLIGVLGLPVPHCGPSAPHHLGTPPRQLSGISFPEFLGRISLPKVVAPFPSFSKGGEPGTPSRIHLCLDSFSVDSLVLQEQNPATCNTPYKCPSHILWDARGPTSA